MASFVSTDELAARLGVTLTSDEETRAETLITAASGVIQRAARQTIELVEDDEVVRRGTVERKVRLPERPIVSISNVELAGLVLVENTDFYVDGQDLVRDGSTRFVDEIVTRRYALGWGSERDELLITYTHGYEDAPDPIKAVCLEVLTRVWVNPGSVMMEDIGSERTRYDMQARPSGLVLSADERRTVREAVRPKSEPLALR